MEICLSIVGKVIEYAVEPAIRHVGYVIHCKRNLQDLQTAVDNLNDTRKRVDHKSTEALNKGDQKIEDEVTKWLERVGRITAEAKELGKEDIQAKMSCLYGFCPNVKLRHKIGRNSKNLKPVIRQLGKKEFSTVSYYVRPQELCLISISNYRAFDSRESSVKKIMDELRVPSTKFIMVYGVGGVGKTTLVDEVLRRAHEEKIFADEIMVRAAEKLDLAKIQKEIARQLGVEVRQDEEIADLARRICGSIKDKQILVILDNMLEKFDLESLGIPCLPTCRIVLTSRTRDVVCSDKWSPKEFRLDVLDGNDSWSLFKMKAGDHILKDRAIENVAMKVVEKCGGLPVLIVAVARALRNRSTPHAWNEALRNLHQFVNQDSIEEEAYSRAYSGLEWSYNQLNDVKNLKPLLLLCGILQYTVGEIVLSHLLKYAMGLSLLKNVSAVEDANDALYSRIEELKDACLLLETEDKSSVRMHELICDVAIRIASRNQRALLRARGGDSQEWPSNKEFYENCTKISLSNSTVPKLPEVLQCQELQLFQFVGRVKIYGFELLGIPDSFFKEMRKLMVLSLTNLHLSSLPASLAFLRNLKTLCLHRCLLEDIALVGQLTTLEVLSFVGSKFEELPREIGNLTRLRLLDLTECFYLLFIAPGVISGLKSLQDLRMIRYVVYQWELQGLEELKELSHLAALGIRILDLSMVPTGLFSDKLKKYQILIGSTYKLWYDVDQTVNTLMINVTHSRGFETGIQTVLAKSEVLFLNGDSRKIDDANIGKLLITSAITRREVVPSNLTRLNVHNCAGLKALFTYPMARSLVELKYLEVDSCVMMEEIVSAKEHGEEIAGGMFLKLQHLVLSSLIRLSRFSSRINISIEFPSLESLRLDRCLKLETLILDPESERTYSFISVDKSDGDGDAVFPQLSVLSLTGMPKLIYVYKDDSSSARPLFPNLEELQVVGCFRLKDLGSSTIPFQNLTSLEVNCCHSLTHITTYATAKSSMRLRKMTVANCKRMTEIVTTSDGDDGRIAFSQLGKLILYNLPSLQDFCSRNCTVKFPSLKSLLIENCSKLKINCLEWKTSPELQGVEMMKKDDNLRFLDYWNREYPMKINEEEEDGQ